MADTSDDPRVYFAAERTLLAWIRTGLALMGLGFLVARFDALSPSVLSQAAGSLLIMVAVVFTTVAAVTYVGTVQRLKDGRKLAARPSPLALALSALLALTGLALAVYVWVGLP